MKINQSIVDNQIHLSVKGLHSLVTIESDEMYENDFNVCFYTMRKFEKVEKVDSIEEALKIATQYFQDKTK